MVCERCGHGRGVCEEWWRDGKQHRDGGPAVIARDQASGAVTYEEWWREGRLHREDGPAVIDYDAETGLVTHAEWWLNGVRQEPPRREAAPAAPRP